MIYLPFVYLFIESNHNVCVCVCDDRSLIKQRKFKLTQTRYDLTPLPFWPYPCPFFYLTLTPFLTLYLTLLTSRGQKRVILTAPIKMRWKARMASDYFISGRRVDAVSLILNKVIFYKMFFFKKGKGQLILNYTGT